MLLKIANNLVANLAIDKEKRPIRPTQHTGNSLENSYMYQIPMCTSDYRKESFFPRAIREWNFLPPEVV
jgi:hypothetical protein